MVKLKLIKGWYHVGGKNKHGIKIPRKATGLADYEAAEAYRLTCENATQWPMPVPVKPKERMTIGEALEQRILRLPEYSSSRRTYRTNVTNGTIRPLAALKPPIIFMDEVTSEALETLQQRWRDVDRHSHNTMRNYREQSNSVFKWAVDFDHIQRNPWKIVRSFAPATPTRDEKMMRQGKREGNSTLPLDVKGAANWNRILATLPGWLAQRRVCAERPNPLLLFPGVFLALLQVMYETGLRRSDAILIRPDWIVDTPDGGGSYHCIQMKTGDPVTVYLPQYLVEVLRGLPLLPWRGAPSRYEKLSGKEYGASPALYPFYNGGCATEETYLEGSLGSPLRQFGQTLGFQTPKKGGTGYDPKNPMTQSLRPHRFRDSFAVNMLNLGMSLYDLKTMLGHKSILTTEKYYTPFVLSRSEALQQKQALARRAMLFDGAVKAQTAETMGLAEHAYEARDRVYAQPEGYVQ